MAASGPEKSVKPRKSFTHSRDAFFKRRKLISSIASRVAVVAMQIYGYNPIDFVGKRLGFLRSKQERGLCETRGSRLSSENEAASPDGPAWRRALVCCLDLTAVLKREANKPNRRWRRPS